MSKGKGGGDAFQRMNFLYQVRGKGKKRQTITCLVCGTIKRFPTKRGYQLWYDSIEAREKASAAKVQQPPGDKA
ncbi:hypothetical protein IscW_ISCW021685 [Ixodes scapularis]|uniref:Uncharacterized protein n=1 Tax=Ixodes scapularis TaxID=6945 RepID=B7Q660_IXOSC|nr:hypothetical protein IscW_ISCW021685 [Ixodes scapularis]|eukprot:XP_002411898.1 hypothetical protein IscW_ISCW021685 [Ixodes scapularis]